jgi:DNA-binding MarR family transcriptional regulator
VVAHCGPDAFGNCIQVFQECFGTFVLKRLMALAYLVAVDRHGSFSEAANQCFVAQPTLSMQIQKLEIEWGVTLFDRGRKSVEATPIGKAAIDRAYRTLREVKTRLLEILRRSVLKGVPDGLKVKRRDWRIIGAKPA